MKLNARSYPHPVLGNSDDFPDTDFQAAIALELTAGPPAYYRVACKFSCGNNVIEKMIANKEVAFTVHVECTATVFRQSFTTYDAEAEFKLPIEDIAEAVSLTALIVANKDVAKYAPKGAHPDYGGKTFALRKADILGQDRAGTKVFPLVDFDGDAVSAWLKVRRAAKRNEKAMKFNESRDYMWVELPQKDFDNWLKVQKINRVVEENIASPPFVLAAVMFAIGRVRDEAYVYDEESGFRWGRALHSQLEELAPNWRFDEPCETAQLLLNGPIGRLYETVLSVLNSAGEE